jgi:hypothetical protein
MWPIGVLGLLVFAFGFRWHLLALVAFFLGAVALQGYHRFMLILPLLYFAAFYLQEKRRRWPTVPIVIGAAIVALVFPAEVHRSGASIWRHPGGPSQFSQVFIKEKQGYGEILATEDFLDQFAGGLLAHRRQ